MLQLNEYQELASRTINNQTANNISEKYCNFAMGLCGESGEIVDMLKKVVFHQHKLNKELLKTELSDALWYLAALATTAGISLNEVAEKNLDKLNKRYPNGFNVESSLHRKD